MPAPADVAFDPGELSYVEIGSTHLKPFSLAPLATIF
jgi:hypothetical protein